MKKYKILNTVNNKYLNMDKGKPIWVNQDSASYMELTNGSTLEDARKLLNDILKNYSTYSIEDLQFIEIGRNQK